MANVSEAFKETIKLYLDQIAEIDDNLAERYANPKKSIDECCEYILGQVHSSGMNGFADDEIYGMAVHYYEEDDLGDWPKAGNCKAVVNHHIELTPEEIEEARKEAKERIVKAEEDRMRQKEKNDAEAAKKKAEEAKKKAEANGEMSLFDGLF